jgi:7-carboxy-7-deazaguanine synthase
MNQPATGAESNSTVEPAELSTASTSVETSNVLTSASDVRFQVSEVFGPTFQGEGPSTGRHALFVRLGLCNLACVWCDTKYTWDWDNYNRTEELQEMSVWDITAALGELWNMADRPTTVVISGGEPLMHKQQLPSLVKELRRSQHRVEIETAGTILPSRELIEYVTQWNVSPKLQHSGNLITKRRKLGVLQEFAWLPNAYFKFVVQTADDLAEIDEIINRMFGDDGDPNYLNDRIYVMPEGQTAYTLKSHTDKVLLREVLARGWNFSYRLHTVLWGDSRGH